MNKDEQRLAFEKWFNETYASHDPNHAETIMMKHEYLNVWDAAMEAQSANLPVNPEALRYAQSYIKANDAGEVEYIHPSDIRITAMALELMRLNGAPCATCNDDPAVCATVPGLRHCEKAQREAQPVLQSADEGRSAVVALRECKEYFERELADDHTLIDSDFGVAYGLTETALKELEELAVKSASENPCEPVAWWLTGDKRHEDCLFFSEKWARETCGARLGRTPDATLRVEPLYVAHSTSKEFTTHELAREVLRQFSRDIPNTVVAAMTVVLERFVRTGEYIDDMGMLLGKQPVPPLGVQRFDEERKATKLRRLGLDEEDLRDLMEDKG